MAPSPSPPWANTPFPSSTHTQPYLFFIHNHDITYESPLWTDFPPVKRVMRWECGDGGGRLRGLVAREK